MIDSICIYTLTFIVSITFSFLYTKAKNKIIKKMLIIFSVTMPIIISTFRYNVGIDYFNYKESFYYINKYCTSFNSILQYYQEPFHVILNIVAYRVFNSYSGFLFLSSLIFMLFSFKAITKYENNISITLAYFIFFMTMFSVSFNGIRQMIAVAIIFFGYDYIYKRKFWNYLFFVVLAALFHKSAMLGLLLYLVWFDKGKKNKSFIICATVFMISIPFVSQIIQRICSFLGIYNKYFKEYNVSTTYGFLLYIMPLVFLLIIGARKKKKYSEEYDINENEKIYNFYFRLYILQIPLQLLGNYIAYADRMALYLLPSQIVLIPIFLNFMKKNKAFFSFLIIVWYIFYYVFMFIILKSNGVYPFFWSFK